MKQSITTLTTSQIKALRRLSRREERRRQNRMLVEGWRAVEQVLLNRLLEVEMIVVAADLERAPILQMIRQTRGTNPVDVREVPRTVFDQLADTDAAQGIMLVCRLPEALAEAELLTKHGVLLALDGVQDPGNLGTLVRTAVWFGLAGLALGSGSVDLFHPKVVRSTAGATGVLPWMEGELPAFLSQASRSGWRVCLLDATPGAVSYDQVQPTGRDILVAGNEANGLSAEILQHTEFVRMRIEAGSDANHGSGVGVPGVESLNVAVASAIVMAHFCSR